MSNATLPINELTDRDLLEEARLAAERERGATARLIALLAQVDVRRLYLGEGCSSLFTYCTQVLHLSEHAAYGRIQAARAACKFPIVLGLLADGSVTLTAVTLLAPHLTGANHRDLLDSARHKSKREVEQIVADIHPRPPVPTVVRKLPVSQSPGGRESRAAGVGTTADTMLFAPVAPPTPTKPAVVRPLAPERFKVQFTVSAATHDKLRRAQDLLRHTVPDGDPAAIFDRALTLLLGDLERVKYGAAEQPRTGRPAAAHGSRHIPASVRREVWRRDGAQCAFVGRNGRCSERGFLEFHHVRPHADGGAPVVENIELRCRAHNLHEAHEYFGRRMPLFVREVSSDIFASTRSGRSIRETMGVVG